MSIRGSSWLAVLSIVAISACRKPPVEALIDRTIEAYGGKAALERLHGIKETGRVTSIRQGNSVGSLIRGYLGSDHLRVEIAQPNAPGEVRVLDGARGWRDGEEVTGASLDAMVLQAARLALPQLLLKERAKVVDAGIVSRGGKVLSVLRLPLRPTLNLFLEIDPKSGRIEATRGVVDTAEPNGKLEFGTTYGDFRKVDGVLFPFAESTTAMGVPTGDVAFQNIELFDSFPPEVFRP